MLIDTHCHLNLHQYDEDRDQVVQRAAQAGVTRIIIPAIDVRTGNEAIQLATRYEGVYAAAGCHPNDIGELDFAHIEAQTGRGKVVAIGEIGLDYHWNTFPREQQIRAFEQQLELAARLNLPVIIHNRDASHDVVPILETWVNALSGDLKAHPGVLHSVSAPMEYAERALEVGFYLGFTGPITFKKAVETREIARITPADRILVETDGPYLSPEPYRGKRNEPAYIPYITAQIAQVRGVSPEAVAAMTTANAERLFRLPHAPELSG
jgi:TatD DNase family protein